MSKKILVLELLGLILAVFFYSGESRAQGFVGCATGNENVSSSSLDFEQEVLNLVNIERKKRKLKPLALDEDLNRAARYHAKDMAEDDYFNHNTFDRRNGKLTQVSGCTTFERARKFTTKYGSRAENISAGQTTPQEVMQTWMNSSGHRANILNKNYTHIGIGYYKTSKSYQYYWTQCFGG